MQLTLTILDQNRGVNIVALKEDYRNLANRLAQAILTRDFIAAHHLLAPWLQQSFLPATLEQMIQAEVNETVKINELEGEHYPCHYELDYNTCSIEDLRQSRSYRENRSIAPEVNSENFRQWMVIQFQAEEGLEIDAYMDLWMAIVEVNGEYRIGYFEMEDPD